MLAQTFAVIAREQDDRVLIDAFLLKLANQASHLGVGESDLAIVETIFVLVAVGGRRTIGIMGVVEMHPEKELLLIVLVEPFKSLVGNCVSGSLHLVEIRFLQPAEIKVIVIEIESVIQSEARVEKR